MPDQTPDDTAAWLTATETVETTISTPDGDLPITVEDVTLGELQALDDEVGEAGDETDVIRNAIRDYLIEPEVDADDIPLRKVQTLFNGMMSAWAGQDDIQDALEELDLGNET